MNTLDKTDEPLATSGGLMQKTLDEERKRAAVAQNELRVKLHMEKTKELTAQKEAMQSKFEMELQKVTRLKDAELQRLQCEMQKCRQELSEVSAGGLSGAARENLEAERRRLLVEVQELRICRRNLEQAAALATETERQNVSALRRAEETKKSELVKAKKESDIEMRKVLDELKVKDRVISQLERDAESSRCRKEREPYSSSRTDGPDSLLTGGS